MKYSHATLFLEIFLSIILIIGASKETFSQVDTTHQPTKFSILVESTGDGIKLICKEGCAWKELTLLINDGDKIIIDEYGMATEEISKPKKERKWPNFQFIVRNNKYEIGFEGLRGTSWKRLKFNCDRIPCWQQLDQAGISRIK